MTDYKFIDISNDLMDMVVDAEFESQLPPSKVQAVLRIVSDALAIGTNMAIYFEGLSVFQISEKGIKISFRFSRNSDDMAKMTQNKRDELLRTRTHFVIHVFAKVDDLHKLGSVPFPPDFRNLLVFPQ